jgi:hypothetical protein
LLFDKENEARHHLMKARLDLGLSDIHKYEMDIREIEVN